MNHWQPQKIQLSHPLLLFLFFGGKTPKIGPPTGEEQSLLEILAYNSSIYLLDAEEASIVKAYNDFSATLLQPECAMLVQGMHSCLRNLGAPTTWTK